MIDSGRCLPARFGFEGNDPSCSISPPRAIAVRLANWWRRPTSLSPAARRHGFVRSVSTSRCVTSFLGWCTARSQAGASTARMQSCPATKAWSLPSRGEWRPSMCNLTKAGRCIPRCRSRPTAPAKQRSKESLLRCCSVNRPVVVQRSKQAWCKH